MPKIISPNEFARLMEAIRDTSEIDGDYEVSHVLADKLMIETLEAFGYNLESFKKMKKWYA